MAMAGPFLEGFCELTAVSNLRGFPSLGLRIKTLLSIVSSLTCLAKIMRSSLGVSQVGGCCEEEEGRKWERGASVEWVGGAGGVKSSGFLWVGSVRYRQFPGEGHGFRSTLTLDIVILTNRVLNIQKKIIIFRIKQT